ncbi:isocitrate lyase/PEP mutase family protein [Chryseolinea lacunae]|uniref:Isocitrate lyase/phosphoenolpyruvate mutase family protein n=1 Tax=Chryseolinea lacunae TaxID=2801331 RepID=A0ABS1KN35_9BACT|nr:isocitrate lyase/phosphoenolpyruvate mutase family protein [Chryseolinea lacunae]MBL0740764.1 isocitrate lyase/phosphoenolpyruvate mutase family protein [Chryseolinea lacunae]
MSKYEIFSSLHRGEEPLLLGNLWDVNSATLFEAAGYKAVGTSSQAVAKSLGYEDGENIPFEWLLQLAKRTVERVRIPVTIDMESGYARTIDGIIANLEQLHDVGVVGINIEDTVPASSRTLRPAAEFQDLLSAIVNRLQQKNIRLFVNVRTDGFLLGLPNALPETLERIHLYDRTGIDGIFVPCITASDDIRAVTSATQLPVNVMCMPHLPDFAELKTLGVKRISMGPFVNIYVNNKTNDAIRTVASENSFASLFQ